MRIAFWPSGQNIGSGLVRTEWKIETIDKIPDDKADLLDSEKLNRLSRSMSFDVRIEGPRSLVMDCTCADEIPGPMRLGSASQAWRFIDERVARLWKIGDYLRVDFPEFMRQRRKMLEQIPQPVRKNWLWLAVIRSEPLCAQLLERPSEADRLLSALPNPGSDSTLVRFFSEMCESMHRGTNREDVPNVSPLRKILGQAIGFGVHGVRSGSVDSMAYATELLFDALHIVDCEVFERSAAGYTIEEDRIWFSDAV